MNEAQEKSAAELFARLESRRDEMLKDYHLENESLDIQRIVRLAFMEGAKTALVLTLDMIP